jgi:hypothetical protein
MIQGLYGTSIKWAGVVVSVVVGFAAPLPSSRAEAPSVELAEPSAHPLQKTLQYATARAEHIRNHVSDYTCQLVKRERIAGTLQSYQFAVAKVRCEQRKNDEVAQPMAVLMEFKKPASMNGRLVLYVEGENDGMVLVRKGGRGALKNVELKFDPLGTAAKRESTHPISDMGLARLIERLIERIEEDIAHDPTGINTKVSYYRKAKVQDRECTHIEVIHPQRGDGIDFHRASLYVDDETQIPVRLVAYDWPTEEGGKPVLLEEYNYMNLKLNVGLSDEEFRKSTHFDEE